MIMPRIFLFLLACLMSVPATFAQKGQQDAERLFRWFKAAGSFDYRYPREKVYLHLDNNSYLEGDTLRYKAYVVRASTLRPTTLSRVLYVELLNADGQTASRQILHIDSLGQADGAIPLINGIKAGYYEVRGYTREMTNWGPSACFSRIVPVFTGANPQRKLDRTQLQAVEDLTLPEPEPHGRVTVGTPRPYVMEDAGRRQLTFYPEGGWRVKGLPQRIAYKVTDGRGRPVTDTLTVYGSGGELLTQVTPDYEGMGAFVLPAGAGDAYALLTGDGMGRRTRDNRYPLPQPEGCVALEVGATHDELTIDVTANDSLVRTGALLGVAVTHRELPCYFDTLTAPRETVELALPTRQLRTGVNRVVVYDLSGRTLASRLVWITTPDTVQRRVEVTLEQNELTYAPFSPAVMRLRLTRPDGSPVQTTLSLAVRDKGSNITGPADGGVAADLLLASELRGYIARPDLYFVRDDAAHRHMLDLLLMVQGWEAQRWETMCGVDSFSIHQPIEERLILRGRLVSDKRKPQPLAGWHVDFKAYSLTGGAIDGTARTDSAGRFAFASNILYTGDFIGQFTLTDTLGKRRWTRLMLDRWFSPSPQPFYAPALELIQPAAADSAAILLTGRRPATFEWTDTIPYTIPKMIKEATIVARRKYHGFTGNRYTWLGGEKAGQKYGTKFFNIALEVEHAKDLGLPMVTMGELFAFLDSEFDTSNMDRMGYDALDATYDEPGAAFRSQSESSQTAEAAKVAAEREALASDSYVYHGRALTVYLNNEPLTILAKDYPELYGELRPEEIQSGYLVRDNTARDAVTGERKRVSGTRDALYLYEIPDFYRYRSKKGIDKRRIQGFTAPTAFYAPDYRKLDLPNEKDTRRTLHWAPSLRTDARGEATIIFYTNARPAQWLDVTLRGVTSDGRFIDYDR